MHVRKLLEAASLLVPEEIATDNDVTINDVWDYLAHDEWEVALGLLEELGDVRVLPLSFWENLATAAEQMQLKNSTAWCHWRCYETRNGLIRADLILRPASESRRQTPFSGAGALRPMWNIGNRLRPANRLSTSLASGSRPDSSWDPASEPRCDSPPSTLRSGEISSPAKRSPCTRTGPSLERLSFWRSTVP